MNKWLNGYTIEWLITIQHQKLNSSPFLRGQVCEEKPQIKYLNIIIKCWIFKRIMVAFLTACLKIQHIWKYHMIFTTRKGG